VDANEALDAVRHGQIEGTAVLVPATGSKTWICALT
jgi:hypothetical protein